MEIRHLRTFKAIIDLGGFTKAADYLGYAQSTITSHIRAIENELGQPIFDRIGKKVLLTETGKLLVPHALKMLSIYKDVKEITSSNGEIRGDIVISAPEALLIYRLPPVIKEFKEKCPNVNIELKHLDPTKLKEDLTTGNVDLAFVLDTEKVDDDIYFEELVDEQMMFISPNNGYQNTIASLENQVHLFTEKGCGYRLMFQDILKEYNIQNQKNIEFWSIEAIKQCIVCGIGVSLLPYITVKNEIEQKKIMAQEVKTDELLSTYLAYHKNKWLAPSFKIFSEIVRRHAQEWRDTTTIYHERNSPIILN
ncbi:LysR family transcriptional regulator [Cytobacillus sp. NCCP-133]|uniref:LysR family transcriptional regulator n=1 Tax=Cytobacillus sp. NCCP-133 TaxID=766848 RepID=UPI00222E299F|nr:LysR family transcriptional regulator [Cytobacillus sp. NCCP-133]GLB61003.1 LysR family transcriptional regulator [Cytobacillus sp. NCCP-133]